MTLEMFWINDRYHIYLPPGRLSIDLNLIFFRVTFSNVSNSIRFCLYICGKKKGMRTDLLWCIECGAQTEHLQASMKDLVIRSHTSLSNWRMSKNSNFLPVMYRWLFICEMYRFRLQFLETALNIY